MKDKEDEFIKDIRHQAYISENFFNDVYWDKHIERLNEHSDKDVELFHKIHDKILNSIQGYPVPFCLDIISEVLVTIEYEYQDNPKNHMKGFRNK